jgi:formate dehydrogenase assembly factor FdhD
VQTHEQEHVADLQRLTNSELKPYDTFLLGLSGAGKDEKECVNNLVAQIGGGKDARDAKAVVSFVDKWQAAVNVYDKPTGTHHSKFNTTSDAHCEKLKTQEV